MSLQLKVRHTFSSRTLPIVATRTVKLTPLTYYRRLFCSHAHDKCKSFQAFILQILSINYSINYLPLFASLKRANLLYFFIGHHRTLFIVLKIWGRLIVYQFYLNVSFSTERLTLDLHSSEGETEFEIQTICQYICGY